MGVTIVIGGQFGGEGKGKVAYFLAKEVDAKIAIRGGGTNSGHTVIDPKTKEPLILRQLPTASILQDITCVLCAGSYINLEILFDEIKKTGISEKRLIIDPNAMIISETELKEEKNGSLRASIASTLSGTGAAVKRRIDRNRDVRLAKHEDRLQQFIQPVVPFVRDNLSKGENVIIEGTQGFGLSLLHSPYYPYVTSRDTTASAFLSEAGLSPLDVDDIVMVIRTFPIRVGGNSGPLPDEIDWDTLTKESQSKKPLFELTSVTKTIRRIARFNADVVRQAIMVNQPTKVVLNHLDYIDPANNESENVGEFIEKVEHLIGKQINFLGYGPANLENRTKALVKS